MASTTSPETADHSTSGQNLSERASSLIRRSAHTIHDVFAFPFSNQALSSLPTNPEGRRERATRVDNIPDQQVDVEHPNYQSITGLPPGVRIPKKIATPIKVEAKVWFANERTWISYVNVCILLGTLSAALFNASKDNVARNLAYTYALISLVTLCYSYVLYQRRVTMIRRRDPSHFDALVGPVLICVALFLAVLTNFIIRVREFQKHNQWDAPSVPTPV
ncbi:hypothetical protein FRB96_004501 [Tulasnella sp. 330]|nr:hypothetical protein FRB96_004501 [Tulasnella sp. 330]KAG8886343.1 hypothetical protein FRB97_004878 [Tulasnella sp. 331]KAG8890788.1 hypothetical protein FRB98_004833 [Tulasnella sp. 332]